MSDSRPIDALIDDTARAMTAGEPPGDIRAAVSMRLTGSRRVISWRPRLAAAVAFGALLVAVNLALRDNGAPPPLQSGTRAGELTIAVPRLSGPRPRLTEPPEAPAVVRPAQLPLVAPIVVESLDVEPLAGSMPMEIQILDVPMPLLAERLDIQPLDVFTASGPRF